MKKYVLSFSGLHCESCVKLVTKRLTKLAGVEMVTGNAQGEFILHTTLPLLQGTITQSLSGTEYRVIALKEE